MDITINKTGIEKYINEANKLIAAECYGYALDATRKGLEITAKQLCEYASITSDTRELNLKDMIDVLYEKEIISQSLKNAMHSLRVLGNSEIHVDLDSEEVTKQDALNAVEQLQNLKKLIDEYEIIENKESIITENNVPMPFPNFHDSKKRFYGKWENANTYESLATNKEFIDLCRKATENNDIEAMLNIALGFLPREIGWKKSHITMPEVNMGIIATKRYNNMHAFNKISYNTSAFTSELMKEDTSIYIKDSENCIDGRYYYWIIRAVDCASELYKINEPFPMKYIATAIWEAFQYIALTACLEIHFILSDSNKIAYTFNRKAINLFSPIDKYFDLRQIYTHVPETLTDWYALAENVFSFGNNLISPVYQDANIDTLAKLEKITKTSASYTLDEIKTVRKEESNKRKQEQTEKEEEKKIFIIKSKSRKEKEIEIEELEKEIRDLEQQKNDCIEELESLQSSIFTEMFNKSKVIHYETKIEVLNEEIKNKTLLFDEKIKNLIEGINNDILDYFKKYKINSIKSRNIASKIPGINYSMNSPHQIIDRYFYKSLEDLEKQNIIKYEYETITLIENFQQ